MICIHHNKDMDGYTSGAIVKHWNPDVKLIGWDYKDPIPDFEDFGGEDIIMIDISFPMDKMVELVKVANSVTWIDHHISARKDWESKLEELPDLKKIGYVYELGKAACEIGWKHFFPDKQIPFAVTLIGRYDTWRQDEGDWENITLPFKYHMYGICNSAETFPKSLLLEGALAASEINTGVLTGRAIMNYQHTMDESIATKNYFVMENVFGGLTALCLNYYPFSSETLKSIWDPELYDIMVGFVYVGHGKWSVSLRSVGDKVDCSVIAKARGGGGHKNAAGYEVSSFDKIFE